MTSLPQMVPIKDVLHHVATLKGAGWSNRAIGAAAGLSATAIENYLRGRHREVRWATERAILAIDPTTLPRTTVRSGEPYVSKVGTVRRIQALQALGWPHRVLIERTGLRTDTVLVKNGRVRRTTHDAVAAVYRDLANTPGPSLTTRTRAAGLGYVTAAAWDDIDLDEHPYLDDQDDQTYRGFDEVAVLRRLDGDHTATLTRIDRVEVVARARARGWSYLDIERRAGLTKPERYLTRSEDVA